MGGIFRIDSPLMKLLTLLTNLVCLNVLWVLCCIPVITAGAATTAMFYVVFQYITKQDDAVLKPFFRAFKENFRAVTPVWILNLLIGAVMAAEFFYMSQGAQTWLKVAFGIVLFVYGGATSYLYPIMARYDVPPKIAVLNSFALSTRHIFSTICVLLLNALPIVLAVFAPESLQKYGLIWFLGGISLIAYVNGTVLMTVFKKHEKNNEA